VKTRPVVEFQVESHSKVICLIFRFSARGKGGKGKVRFREVTYSPITFPSSSGPPRTGEKNSGWRLARARGGSLLVRALEKDDPRWQRHRGLVTGFEEAPGGGGGNGPRPAADFFFFSVSSLWGTPADGPGGRAEFFGGEVRGRGLRGLRHCRKQDTGLWGGPRARQGRAGFWGTVEGKKRFQTAGKNVSRGNKGVE